MINVRISPNAFLKIQALVMGYEREVGWYGTVERIDQDTFRILDIFVYPQYSSGAYIDDKWEEIEPWLDTLTDEEYNAKRFHGHSHVNMSAFPSGTDKDTYEQFKHQNANARENRFTLELIINKRADMYWKFHDAERDYECDHNDMNIQIEINDGLTMEEYYDQSVPLVKELKSARSFCFKGSPSKVVQPKTTTPSSKYGKRAYGGQKGYGSYRGHPAWDEDYYDWDDYGDCYSNYYGTQTSMFDDEEEEKEPEKLSPKEGQAKLASITGAKYVVNIDDGQVSVIETDIMSYDENILFDACQCAYKIKDDGRKIENATTLLDGMIEAVRGVYGEFDLIMVYDYQLKIALTPEEFNKSEEMFECPLQGYEVVLGDNYSVLALYVS